MTVLKYFLSCNVGTTAEILALKRDNPKDFDIIMAWTREQMRHNGIEIDESAK